MKSDVYPNTWYNPKKQEMLDLRAKFAFDMDSVLSETGGILQEGIKKKYGVDDIRIIHNGYETFMYHVDGVSHDEIYDTINTIISEESGSCLPTPFMERVLSYYYDSVGEPITIVTARAEGNMQVTFDWLNHNLPVDVPFNLIMVNGMQKDVVLKRLRCQVFVDDRYETVASLHQAVDIPVLYRRPWNQGRPYSAGLVEINDLRDMIPLFNLYSGRAPMAWPGYLPYPDRIGRGKMVDLYA